MNPRNAKPKDLAAIQELLAANELPWSDCTEHLGNFVVIEKATKGKTQLCAVGGMEVHGNIGLIRSICVQAECRDRGLGKVVYKSLEDRAGQLGLNGLFLITTTAETYFERLGYHIQDRSSLPDPICKTRQFSELCPTSAIVMKRDLNS